MCLAEKQGSEDSGYSSYTSCDMLAPAIKPQSSSVLSAERSVVSTNWGEQQLQLTNIKPKKESGICSRLTPQKTVGSTLARNEPILSPFRTYIYTDSLLETDPSTWEDMSTFEKGGSKNSPLSKFSSPGTTGKTMRQVLWPKKCNKDKDKDKDKCCGLKSATRTRTKTKTSAVA